jgi:hypothetical protein
VEPPGLRWLRRIGSERVTVKRWIHGRVRPGRGKILATESELRYTQFPARRPHTRFQRETHLLSGTEDPTYLGDTDDEMYDTMPIT